MTSRQCCLPRQYEARISSDNLIGPIHRRKQQSNCLGSFTLSIPNVVSAFSTRRMCETEPEDLGKHPIWRGDKKKKNPTLPSSIPNQTGNSFSAAVEKNKASKKGIAPEGEGNKNPGVGALEKNHTALRGRRAKPTKCINTFKTAKSERKQLPTGKKKVSIYVPH